MKWFKRLMLAAVLLVIFIVIAMVGIVLLVDPNDYRDEIQTAVKQHTGRDLVMEGEIGLSVFPWLGLELNRVRLNNPSGFTDEIFAAVERVNIKVALMPLFRMETRVGNLELDGLTVNLEKRNDGVTNWDDLVAAAEAQSSPGQAPAPTPEQEPADKTKPPSTIPEFYVGSLDITNTDISWRDASTKTFSRIEGLSFTTGEILPFKAIPFKLEFSVRNESPKLLAGARLEGAVRLDLVAEQYELENLKLDLQAAGTVVPGGDQTVQLLVPRLAVLTKQQKLLLEQLQLQVAGLNTTLDVQVLTYEENPQVTGQLSAQIPQLRKLMQDLGIEPPVTADPNVLNAVQAQLAFKADSDSFEMQNLNATLDDTHITGTLAMNGFESPAYRMDLNIDKINADRYLPPPEPEPVTKKGEEPPAADTEIPVPVEDLRALKAEGNLKFGELQVMKLKLANLEAGLKSEGKGIVQLEPLSVDLYDGNFQGAITLDVTGEVPSYKISTALSKVQIEPLLFDYMQSRFISGQMNAKFDISTAGNRISHFKRNLNGKGDLNFRDGALSFNVREKIRESKAKLLRQAYDAPPKQPTTFSAIHAGLDFNEGMVSNKDLEVRAGHLYITGEGEYSLASDAIDYVVTLLFTEDPMSQDESLKDVYDLPIKMQLKGKLAELNYAGIATSGVTGAIKAKAKRAFEGKTDAAKEEVKKQLDPVRKETEKKRKEKEDELKDKLKEKLKLPLD